MLSFWYQTRHISSRMIRTFSAAFGATIGFLAVMRLTYEWLFPLFDWTGRVEIVTPLALIIFAATIYFIPRTRLWWLPLPLLINLIWLIDPAVHLIRGRLLFSASLWLIALFWLDTFTSNLHLNKRRWLFTVLLTVPIACVYLLTMSHNVGFADTFEFQVTAPKLGIVHPTGYPLFLILGKLWTLIPFGSIAWRLNLGTVVYALLASSVLFWTLTEIGHDKDELGTLRPWIEPAALTASALLVTTPIVWSQAISAEVYTLHLLFASTTFFLMNRLLTQRIEWDRGSVLLALLLGFSMTNHVTTVFFLPASALVMWWSWPKNTLLRSAETYWGRGLQLASIFLAPLLLYAYLPIRWRAVNNESMGISNFFDWVLGRRFGGSLILRAILDDPQRFNIFGQLILDQWPLWLLALAATGAVILTAQHWRLGAALLITLAGFSFYTLSYFVADLAVFMLPIHLIIAIYCGFGLMSMAEGVSLLFQSERLPEGSLRLETLSGLPFLFLIPFAFVMADRYPTLDLSADDGRETWARAVLSQDLAPNSAILADSEKHPPLYYVQQAENLRTDLDIIILPDEAAYRAELDQRVAAGETVYLARFLPQLAGIYNLQAAGPLTAVSAKTQAAPSTHSAQAQFGSIDLLESTISKESPFDPSLVTVDLTWRINETPEEQLKVYLRWQGFDSIFPAGRLPVNDFLPFNGAQPSQSIKDFYQIPLSIEQLALGEITLEAALAPSFTPTDAMDWQPVGTISLISGAPVTYESDPTDFRIMAVDRFNNAMGLSDSGLAKVYLPDQIRPGPLPPSLSTSYMYPITTEPSGEDGLTTGDYDTFANVRQVPTGVDRLKLRCGWLHFPTEKCYLGTINVSGVALPDDAINYADKIALLDSNVNGTVSPGGQIELEATWQGLEQIDEDYTIFIQVLSETDQIVGQLDVKPAQGTRPTNLWVPGETLNDRYMLQLSQDISAEKSYRLIIGFYRLSDFQRLTVIDPSGAPIADHFAIPLENRP